MFLLLKTATWEEGEEEEEEEGRVMLSVSVGLFNT